MSARFPLATLNYLLRTAGAPSSTMGGLAAPSKGVNSDIIRIYNAAVPVRGLFIFKGVPPTKTELDAIDNTVYTTVATSFRYADLLLQFAPSVAPQYVEDKALFSMPPATPIRSGTASWFIFGAFNNSGVTETHSYIMGTVAMDGSGDLNILDTNIDSTKLYRFPQFAFQAPKKFVF